MQSLPRAVLAIIFAVSSYACFSQSNAQELSNAVFQKHCLASYEYGQLTVASEKCSLNEVLESIQEATGVKIERAGSGGDDFAFVLSGPGDPARIVSSILYGSSWNFIVISDIEGSLVRILLTPRSIDAVATSVASSTPTASTPADASTKEKQEKDARPVVVRKELPPGMPQSLYGLYPSLQGTSGTGTGGMGASLGSTRTSIAPSPTNIRTSGPTIGANGAPVLPANIPPEIWKIYPPNLMQLVTSPKPVDPIPPAPAIPPGQVVLWNPIFTPKSPP